jgi:hypothetical protein
MYRGNFIKTMGDNNNMNKIVKSTEELALTFIKTDYLLDKDGDYSKSGKGCKFQAIYFDKAQFAFCGKEAPDCFNWLEEWLEPVIEDEWVYLTKYNIPWDISNEAKYEIQFLFGGEVWTGTVLGNKSAERYVKEGRTDTKYRYKEIKIMNEQEEALKLVKEAKKNLERCEELLKKSNKPETFEVRTPVTNMGGIIFNDRQQSLYVRGGVYGVSPAGGSTFSDLRDDYRWLPCERDELKVGDTAHCIGFKTKDHFADESTICKILSDKTVVYVNADSDVLTLKANYTYWYKLVRKDTV